MCFITGMAANSKTATLKIMETTDVHGNFFGYDFKNARWLDSGQTRAYTYVSKQRQRLGTDHCIMLDAGDVLQGQPCVYFSNFIDTCSLHLASKVMNYMKYDAACFGNHDIEAGKPVYDRWRNDCQYPLLGANIISDKTGKPYAPPYCILKRGGMKIAVVGLLTEAIPMWLPHDLWPDIHFDDIVMTAKKWVEKVKADEKPDLIVGLFHTGLKGGGNNGYNENAAEQIAREVPGFDIIFFGHDHQVCCKSIDNIETGRKVWLLNAGGGTGHLAEAELTYKTDGKTPQIETIKGNIVELKDYEADKGMLEHFSNDIEKVKGYVDETIGTLDEPIYTADYFLGRSTMADLLHTVQLEKTHADISLITPLTYNDTIKAGKIRVRDIFRLYQYENRINVFRLSGKEIRKALETAYSLWTGDISGAEPHAIALAKRHDNNSYTIAAPTFLLMSAGGIKYDVDLSKPKGCRVDIRCMSNGRKFQEDKVYNVAVNSYVGSGGGGLLTEGSGIELKDLPLRIVSTTDKDLRYYIIDYFRNHSSPLRIPKISDWQFIPLPQVQKIVEKDKEILFR